MIGVVFLARAAAGFAFLYDGLLAVSKGTYNGVQVLGIFVGLVIVAMAGLFTIRSNVAKIWREQAEGEKARNAELAEQLATAIRDHAAELATQRLAFADELAAFRAETESQIAKVRTEADEQRALKHQAINERDAANMRTDLGPLMKAFAEMQTSMLACLDALKEKETT